MSGAGSIYRHFEKQFPKPNEGSLRVWWIPQVPGKPFRWPVRDVREASAILEILAAYDDFEFGENIKGDYSNAGGLEVFRNGQWEEWESEDCDDIDTHSRERWPLAHRYIGKPTTEEESLGRGGLK